MNALLRPSGVDVDNRVVRWSILPAILIPVLAVQAQDPAGQVDLLREALAERSVTERIISKEKEDWRVDKQSLQARIEVIRRDMENFRRLTAAAKDSIDKADKKRAELTEDNERRKVAATLLEEHIGALEERTRKLLPRLPPPLAEHIRPISQRMPVNSEQAAEKSLSLSDRYINAIGVLIEISKWNREVTVKNEDQTQPDGSTVIVDAIYLGLGQAYYAGGLDKDGIATVGGIGTATADAWIWKPANDLAPAIQKAISIYKDEELASLVRLPVQIL